MSEYLIRGETVTSIADAIRAKTGETEPIPASSFADKIHAISSGGAPNGTEWFTGLSLPNANTNGGELVYGNGVWNAVKGTELYYSFDGKNWTKNSSVPMFFNTIEYCDGTWVGCSSQNDKVGLYYSYDGVEWTQSYTTSGTMVNLLPKRNGYWLCFYNNGRPKRYIRSIDGVTWEELSMPDMLFKYFKCVYGDGKWIAYGQDVSTYLVSTDAETWNQYSFPFNTGSNMISYVDGLWFLGSNNGGLYYSSDAETWTKTDIPNDAIPWTIRKGNGRILCGFTVQGAGNNIYGAFYSDDGKTWTNINLGFDEKINNVFHENGVWIINNSYAGNNQGCYYSTDCVNWTRCKLPEGVNHLGDALVCANGLLVSSSTDGVFYSPVWEPNT